MAAPMDDPATAMAAPRRAAQRPVPPRRLRGDGYRLRAVTDAVAASTRTPRARARERRSPRNTARGPDRERVPLAASATTSRTGGRSLRVGARPGCRDELGGTDGPDTKTRRTVSTPGRACTPATTACRVNVRALPTTRYGRRRPGPDGPLAGGSLPHDRGRAAGQPEGRKTGEGHEVGSAGRPRRTPRPLLAVPAPPRPRQRTVPRR
jgi:hypothetical protein